MDQRSSSEGKRDTTASFGMSPWLRKGLLVFGAVLVVGMAIGAGLRYANAAPAPWVSLPQSVAPQVAGAHVTGSLSGAQPMTIAVTLQSRNEANLKAYAADVAKPHSRAFHQYLTPAQFALNFGADHNALNAVEHYFQGQGLRLTSSVSGGLFLQFAGNVAQVESALHTHINTYRAPDGRTFFANATAIELPTALAPSILDVAGTENARTSHPAGLVAKANHGADLTRSNVRRPSVARPNVSVSCPSAPAFSGAAAPYTAAGLLPTQLNKVYNFQNTTNPGNGMWAAFVEMDGYSLSDLAQYASCVGISSAIQSAITASSSSTTPFIITQNVSNGLGNVLSQAGQNYGTALTPGANAVSVEEELEVLLGLVPNITHISVIQTANTSMGIQTALSAVANENAAQVVGYQWGMCEADAGFSNASAEEQFFMQMALQGQSVMAATGNNGLYGCAGDGNNFRQFGFAVQDPASDPFVTAVGGAELGLSTNVASTAGWAAEQPWNNYPQNGTLAAGGAGISQFWAAPVWQQNAKAATTAANGAGSAYTGVDALYNPNTTSTSNIPARVVPDVSAAADPTNSSVAIYCSVGSACTAGTSSFSNVGGTTEAEAIWAAATIEANQTSGAPSTGAGGRLSDIAPALYTLYQQDTTGASGAISLNGTNFCDYANQLSGISTTSTTAVTAGPSTVTPVSMANIVVGSLLTVDTGANQENVTVTAVTGTTFTANFTKSHTAGFAIVGAVNTTSPTAITPGVQVVTPVTGTLMENIVPGTTLQVDAGLNLENVLVTATTTTTFTATFTKYHAAGVAIALVAVNTTNASAISIGTQTVTVAAGGMANILVGEALSIAAGGGSAEVVTVTAVTPTSFTANFGSAHNAGTAITLQAINTQNTAAIAIGNGEVVTPVTGTLMQGIYTGEYVHIAAGGGTAEDVQVLSTTATTFTANFTSTHGINTAITAITFATTNTAAVGAIDTVTPASMTGIVVGQTLKIGGVDTATVTAVTGSTFTASGFSQIYAAGATVTTNTLINTTSGASTVTATYPVVVTITPASMTGITSGLVLTFDTGASQENVTVISITGSTFTASFTKPHASGATISARGALGVATNFGQACATAANFSLNDSAPLAAGAGTLVTSVFPQNATYNYQQLPAATAMYGSQAGFSVKGNYGAGGNTYISGYNALTGLGSPNVGPTSASAGQLLGYLTQQSRVALPRTYMVAQGLSDNKYWIASYGTNPYVTNMPANTAWYALNTVAFSGPPVLLDDNNANPQNLIVLGPAMPTATGLAMYNWNIATGTATQIALAGGNLPGAYAGSTTSCTSISGATDGKAASQANNVGVYCVTSTGALYSTRIALTHNAAGIITGATADNWTNSPLLNAVSYAPQISSDNNGNYLVLDTNNGGAGVYYQYFANVGGAGDPFNRNNAIALFPSATGASSGLSPFSFGAPLQTTCLTTPSAAYVTMANLFAIACTASDTKQMWDNVYFPGNGKFNGQWSLLGQPSSSVTFMPGNAVSVDNFATDPAYGQIFYIAEGSDKAMYLDSVNATSSRFLGKSSGWTSISLPGIFNSNSAADFVNS